jgi:hypothetical protein
MTLAILAFGAFVWPTLYRYEHSALAGGDGSQYLVRINRFTGSGQVFTVGGWLPKKRGK